MHRFRDGRFWGALLLFLFSGTIAVSLFTPWPLPLLTQLFAPRGVLIEEPEGSLWNGLRAREVRLEKEGLQWQWRDVSFQLDHDLLLQEQRVVFKDWQAAQGHITLEKISTELTALSMAQLEWRHDKSFEIRDFRAQTGRGALEILSLMSEPSPYSIQLRALDGQVQAETKGMEVFLKLHNFELQPLSPTSPPVTLDHVELTLPRAFEWSPELIRQVFENLLKNPGEASARLPSRALKFDVACKCLRDERGEFHLRLSDSPNLITLALDEYRQEVEANADEEMLSGLIWNQNWAQLTEEQKTQLIFWKGLVRFERPPPLPIAEKTFLDDYRLLQNVSKDADLARLFARIKKSARAGAPAEVLYFASLLTVMGTDCEHASPWLEELTALATTPALQAKTFSLLAQCEKDPTLKRKLLETAATFAPRDQVIKGFLLSAMLSGKDAKKYVNQAKRFLRDKDLEAEAALPVKNALFRLNGNVRAPASQP